MASSARIDELRKKFDENPRRYFAPLANEYRKAGDPEQAIFICQEYLPQQPGHMSGHIVYGQALFELNRHEEARMVFETALSLDPENLIALRHLGDIARNAGDIDSARIWYQRVLEADPRNEEIAQLMLSLLANAKATPASPPTTMVDHDAPTPLSTPAVPVPPAPAMEVDTGFAVEKAEDTTLDLPASAREPEPVIAPPPATVAPAASHSAPKEEELLDLDSFDLGGVPLSTMRASKGVPGESAPEPMIEIESPVADAAVEEAPVDEGAFEADPFAIAATSEPAPEPQPEIELAADLDIGLPDDSPATVEAGMLGGLQTFEAGVLSAEPPVESLALETESFFEAPPITESAPEPQAAAEPEPEPAPEPAPEPEPEPDPVEAFVTETMATLYLQQGHLESALDIYRKLVEQRPDDAGLRSRLQVVEDQVNGAAAPEPEPSAPEPEPEYVAPAPTYGGPTIREFLAGIVSRRTPVYSEPVATPETEPVYQPEPEPEPAPVQADAMRRPSGEIRPTPSSTETVSGSLGALFSGADAAAADTSAANTLAQAFASEGPETAPLVGKPAHRASSELSLNNVFKGGEARPNGGEEGFSFDQFFSESAQTPAPEGSDTPASGAPEATDDIAQFNAWLNGLKKT